MSITIIQIGKTKHSFIEEAEEEYKKRLKPFLKVEILTLKEASSNSVHEEDRARAKAKEGEQILRKIPQRSFCVVLSENGKELDSRMFADLLKKQRDSSRDIVFVIGGPFGLSKEVLERADIVLSFSRFTFTHEMIRVLLLEQIYRGCMINAGRTYHY